MYPSTNSDRPSSKLHVLNGTFPHYIDPKNPPTKKQPFETILNQHFTHTVELLLPEELYDQVWEDIASKIQHLQYERVIMSLSDVLSGDFFNENIKNGNVLMLSEGEPGRDSVYSLSGGQLRFELSKEVYERTGLQGYAIPDRGRKHVKTRFAIQIDLRQPSMQRGRKGFDRIVWACNNILAGPVTWLLHDPTASCSTSESRPIAKHHPEIRQISAKRSRSEGVLTPQTDPTEALKSDNDFEEWSLGIHEWLGLVSLQSPRILKENHVDPFLSRYAVPCPKDSENEATNLIALKWKGLIPSVWVRSLLVHMNAAVKCKGSDNEHYFSLSAYAFKHGSEQHIMSYTVLCPPRADQSVSKGEFGRPFVLFKSS